MITAPDVSVTPHARRHPEPRLLLMCRPTYFDVTYSINPWMDTAVPVDPARALQQWDTLRTTYEDLGHRVELVEGVDGLPDMVFTANAAVVHGGRVLVANFTHPERQPEGPAFRQWFEKAGYDRVEIASHPNEGEGDVLAVGGTLLAGTGFRTARESHEELRRFFEVPVVTLELVDPRFYHLDTALTRLDDDTIAYFPAAFSADSQGLLAELFPDAVLVGEQDAAVFGLNAMSDGRNVVLTPYASTLHQQLRERGFNPIGVDMTELLKAGGSVKCCTLELRS